MADPMSDEPLRDRITKKLAEWAFQAAEAKGVKLTSFHRYTIEQEAPVRADMVMEVVRPELERLRAELAKPKGDEVLDWVAECAKPEHPDWYLDGEKRDCPTCAVETAETERDQARAELNGAYRARDHVRKKNLDVDRILTEALKVHVPPQKRPTLVEAANEAARLIRRQAAELERHRAERDRLAEQVKRARARHTGVCSGACGLDDACECDDIDLICAEDNDRWPCPTRRDLDGTEAGQ